MLVSVIMLAYNAEKTIEDSIKSVLSQNYKEFEYIIINDASTDRTEQIITDYMNKDCRIRYHKNLKNSGVAFSRELGISLSAGEYVAFIDSDDIWMENKLSEQVSFVEKNEDAEFVFTGSRFIDGDGDVKQFTFNVPETVTYSELLKQNVISCSSVLVKREYLEGVFVPDDRMHEDFVAWLNVLKRGIVAYGINKPLLIYRLAFNSRSGNKIKAAKMTWLVYKHIGLNVFLRIYYMSFYAARSVKKYFGIYRK